MKKFTKLFFSMKFALTLLIILALVCTVGSIIPQGNTLEYYQNTYSTQVAGAIMLFGLDDVFHCWWLVTLTVILCANLLGCNVLRFPSLIRRTKNGYSLEKALKNWNKKEVARTGNPEEVFRKTGFRTVEKGSGQNGEQVLYAVKNKVGIWGAWLCHLGMLITIIGFGLGQMMKTEYSVYGVAGQTKPIGDTGYELTIDDFEVQLREDETVEQYLASLTMTDTKTGESQSGKAWVNSPLSLFGMKLYQNSTGWAATMVVRKNGEKIQETVLCAGEYALIEDMEGLSLVFRAFYPDYVEVDGTPMTATAFLNNPGYLYMLYYHDQLLGMNTLTGEEKITLDEEGYEIYFEDPQSYTLIQIKRDPFTKVAALGGLLVLVSLIFAFYLRTAEIWAVQMEDGSWAVAGKSRKGGEEFLDAIRRAVKDVEA